MVSGTVHMRTFALLFIFALSMVAASTRGDDVLYQYEGDVLPHDPSAGWQIFDPCEPPCTESLEPGHFLLSWPVAGELTNYAFRIAEPQDAPPLRCGWNGASAQTIQRGRFSTDAMGASL